MSLLLFVQAVVQWPNLNTFVEEPCRFTSAIPCRAVQSLCSDQLCSFCVQVSRTVAVVLLCVALCCSGLFQLVSRHCWRSPTSTRLTWSLIGRSPICRFCWSWSSAHLIAHQVLDYVNSTRLLPHLQLAYRANHSTETAVTKVLADILLALDGGNLTVLTLLDLSAASDTVDHETLIKRLEVSFGLRGTMLGCFRSYLDGRTQYILQYYSSTSTSTKYYISALQCLIMC